MEGRRQDSAVAETYRTRLAAARGETARLEARHAGLGWTRLAVFGAAVALVVALGRASAPWLAIPIVAFIPLLFVHARVLNARDRARRVADFYDRGLARLENRWQGTGSQGERYRNPSHPYADDLDLFGPGSLFELVATARTAGAEDLLASWLLQPARIDELPMRQRAIEELARRLDLRQELSVIGPEVDALVRTTELKAWAVAPPVLAATWPRVVAPLLAAASTSQIVLWIWSGAPSPLLGPTLLIQVAFALLFRHRVHEVVHQVERREQELEVLAALMLRIEREASDSTLIQQLQSKLRATGRSPALEIRRLARLVDVLSSGHNQIFGPIAALLLVGTQLAFAVESWRRRCGAAVPGWLAAVAEYEALCALATYRAEHPDDALPEFVEGTALFGAKSLAHPLLPAETAVVNDVHLGDAAPRLLIVSGSNMSGKSTLLRTVGINAVLAQAGAPVRASRLLMSPLAIGATLRIHDSLQEGRSRFFAEITRISEVVGMAKRSSHRKSTEDHRSEEATETAQNNTDPETERLEFGVATETTQKDTDPETERLKFGLATETAQKDTDPEKPRSGGVLFLFDELLSGTNSHDRLHGSRGILRALIDLGAIGLVTTHDLALTEIVAHLDGAAANVHFEDRFEAGALRFDYRLRPGVVRGSNAIALMRSVGLDV